METVIKNRKTIGYQVREQLAKKNIKQYEAAKLAGLTDYQVTCIVNGLTSYTADSLIKLSVACDLNIVINNALFEVYKSKYQL